MRVDRKFRVFHNARYPVHRRAPADGRPHRAGRGRRATSRSSCTRASSSSARRSSRSRCPTTSSRGSRARARSAGSGLLIHSTAGFVDPSLEGNLTLELSNVANLPITIYYGMPIGQISFMRMDGPVEKPYGAARRARKYQGQAEPTPSRFYRNFEYARRVRRRSPQWAAALPPGRYQGVDMPNIGPLEIVIDPDHRPDRVRAEAPARARPVDGQGHPRVQELGHERQGRRRRRPRARARAHDRRARRPLEGEVVHDRRS